MTEKFAPWDPLDYLKSSQDLGLYLEACVEEDPGDGSLIRAALNDIARAGNVSALARDAGLTREGLYKALSADGNPSFTTVLKITKALGMRIQIMADVEGRVSDPPLRLVATLGGGLTPVLVPEGFQDGAGVHGEVFEACAGGVAYGVADGGHGRDQ